MARGGARIGAGRPSKSGKAKPPKVPGEVNRNSDTPSVELNDDTPLEYILKVMNDPANDTKTRLQAANLAAPYIHAKKGEGGKKEERGDKAKAAGSGRYSPSPAPLKLVK